MCFSDPSAPSLTINMLLTRTTNSQYIIYFYLCDVATRHNMICANHEKRRKETICGDATINFNIFTFRQKSQIQGGAKTFDSMIKQRLFPPNNQQK